MKKLKIGVIGVGKHIRTAHRRLPEQPRMRTVRLLRYRRRQAEEKADKYKISRRYTDCREMLRALPELDAVSVCTWNCAHAECAIAALEAGKHVFCEKPMAMNAQQAEAMRAAAQKAGKVLGIGFVRRHADDAAFARELVQTGKAGEIYYSRAKLHTPQRKPRRLVLQQGAFRRRGRSSTSACTSSTSCAISWETRARFRLRRDLLQTGRAPQRERQTVLCFRRQPRQGGYL